MSMAPRRDKAWDALREMRDAVGCEETPPPAPPAPAPG
jgi:hypothetical protein